MAGRESVDLVANRRKGLEFRSKVDRTRCFGRAANVEGCDADGVAGSNCSILHLVVEDEGEHAI